MQGTLPHTVMAALRRWWEPTLFLLLTVLHLLPVHAGRWFVTLDGPSHLYSAELLRALWNGDAFLGEFFRINPWPDPYWLGHLLMVPLGTVLPPWAVERVLYSIAVLGLAYAFRYLVRTLAPERIWMSLLVLPFLLHYALRLGFLNFSLSLPLLVLALALGVRISSGEERSWWRLALVLAVLYFAHLTSFLVACALLVALSFWRTILAEGIGSKRIGAALWWWPALIVPFALTLLYVLRQPASPLPSQHLPVLELWSSLIEGRAWNALWAAGEQEASTWTALPMLLGGSLALLWGIRQALRGGLKALPFWSVAWVPALVAYFILPDSMAGGSSASPRLLLFLMLLVAVALATSALPRWSAVTLVICVVTADLLHTRIHYASARSLSEEAEVFLSVSPGLVNDATVLPLNYGSNWMHSNFPNYLGVQGTRVVILDHFTALARFNPVQWRPERLPYTAIGDFQDSDRPCVRMEGYAAATGVHVEQVLTWKYHKNFADSCTQDVRRQLEQGYRPVWAGTDADAVLYRRR
ncbi:MAG: hypothetical protein MUE88_04630 [Flavobacteriales bacterium]|jgi:hypothetical protein|nr:hypothetical protein [Flavobacteriales bacterium]